MARAVSGTTSTDYDCHGSSLYREKDEISKVTDKVNIIITTYIQDRRKAHSPWTLIMKVQCRTTIYTNLVTNLSSTKI